MLSCTLRFLGRTVFINAVAVTCNYCPSWVFMTRVRGARSFLTIISLAEYLATCRHETGLGLSSTSIYFELAMDAFEMPGIGLNAEPCRQSDSACFDLQFQAKETIQARADQAERPAKCLEMSRFPGLGAEKMSRLRPAQRNLVYIRTVSRK